MGNHCCNKMSSSRNSSNSKLDSKLDSMKFEPPTIYLCNYGFCVLKLFRIGFSQDLEVPIT